MRLPAPPHLLLGGVLRRTVPGARLAAAARGPAAVAAAVAVALLAGRSALPALADRGRLVVAAGLVALFLCTGALLGGARLDAVGRSTLAAYAGHHVPLTAVAHRPAGDQGRPGHAGRTRHGRGGPGASRARPPALRLEEGQTLGVRPRPDRSPRAPWCGCRR